MLACFNIINLRVHIYLDIKHINFALKAINLNLKIQNFILIPRGGGDSRIFYRTRGIMPQSINISLLFRYTIERSFLGLVSNNCGHLSTWHNSIFLGATI